MPSNFIRLFVNWVFAFHSSLDFIRVKSVVSLITSEIQGEFLVELKIYN